MKVTFVASYPIVKLVKEQIGITVLENFENIGVIMKTFLFSLIFCLLAVSLFAQPIDFPGTGSNTSSWVKYTLSDGGNIQDGLDNGQNNLDIVSSDVDPSVAYIAYFNGHLFFRLQLADNPISGNGGTTFPASTGYYVVELAGSSATGESSFEILVGVNGKGNPDVVYTSNQAGTTENTVYTSTGFRSVPVTGATTPTTTVTYLDWQVPLTAIQAIWSSFTDTTPFKLYMGVSNSSKNIAGDLMAGSTVDFTIVSLTDLQSVEGGALPVELTSFTAASASSVNGDVVVELNWQTATEVNNYGFEVERQKSVYSSQDSEWEIIGFVQGHGNSNSPNSYNFLDENPPAGNLKYRLKQIDTDGSYTYYNELAEVSNGITSVESATIPTEYSLSQNYPNPFNPSTTIKYSIPNVGVSSLVEGRNVMLKVYDILGNEVATLVNEQKSPGRYQVHFDGSSITSGVYFYKLQAGSFTSVKKMTLVK